MMFSQSHLHVSINAADSEDTRELLSIMRHCSRLNGHVASVLYSQYTELYSLYRAVYSAYSVVYSLYILVYRLYSLVFRTTRRYGPLRGPTSSSYGGFWPLAKAKKELIMLFWPFLAFFGVQ